MQYRQDTQHMMDGQHTQSIEWYHFQWPWVTSDPEFKVTTFFEVLKTVTIAQEEK